jgi:hypothetical protein
MAGRIRIAADAPLGVRYWRLWTAQGATPAMKFVVGDLPEIVEKEIEGDPVPVEVKLPVTINGRIFPREDVDVWSFEARKGQSITCEVCAARLGSPLDSRLEVHDPHGRRIAEDDDTFGSDSFVRFTAAEDGKYQVRIHDVNFHGGQAYVYRLTLTADPHVDRVYPLGGRRGSAVHLELTGQGVPARPVEVALPATGPSDYFHRVSFGGKPSNPFLLDLDDLPEYLETEPNDRPDHVKPLSLPAMANGRIGRPGDRDYWAFTGRKGMANVFELRASQLGSPLYGVLTVSDAQGKELGRAESPDGLSDPSLHFTAPADGTYLVRVEDRFPNRGGPAYAYRLRMAETAVPDFRLHLASDVLALNRGTQGKLKVLVERQGGVSGPIDLTLEGVPSDVTATGTTVAAQQGAAEVTLKAEHSAVIRAVRLKVRGSAKVSGRMVTRTAMLPAPRGLSGVDSVLLAVTVATPFKVVSHYDQRWAPRGTVFHRHYHIDRGGYLGPFEVSLSDRQARHLQGITGPTVLVPPGVSECDYAVSFPPWMETGRTARACVMAVGTLKDADGSEHTVSFSSVQPNEQVIAVIEPGRLGVSIERTSYTATPGAALAMPVRLSRGKSLRGAAKLELIVPAHLRGIAAEPVIVPVDQTSARLLVHFRLGLQGPFNAPLVIRSTVLDKGEPVVAETKVELQPP